MASVRKYHISREQGAKGIFRKPQLSKEAADRVTKLLQVNQDRYHLMYHEFGLHNHIFHHLLCIFALGADPQQMQAAYDLNTIYQHKAKPIDMAVVPHLRDLEVYKRNLGRQDQFNTFFTFFQDEIEAKGVGATVNEYLFAHDERAEDMFDRFFGGYLHCVIHLGYALEFQQPLMVASCLASTAVHNPELRSFLRPVADYAAKHDTGSRSLVQIQDDIRANPIVRKAFHWDYVDKIADGLVPEAGDELFKICSRWRVAPEELKLKTAEFINANAYATALAQRPDKEIRFDFLMLHVINTANLFPVFLDTPWISDADKCRLLEYAGWAGLVIFAENAAPKLYLDELATYRPKAPSGWDEVFRRTCDYDDDGHLCKLVRSMATAAVETRPYADRAEFRIKREEDFLTIAHMIIDSGEKFNEESRNWEVAEARKFSLYPRLMEPEVQYVIARWPKYVGFDEAWYHIRDRQVDTSSRL